MEYKVLIRLYVPEIEENYEIFIPINKTIGQLTTLLNKLINNISGNIYPIKETIKLYNRRTFEEYDINTIVRNTDIKNGTELVIK